MAVKLIVDGLREQAVKQGLLVLRAEIKKAKAKDETLGLITESHDELDQAALDVLEQLGWTPKSGAKGGSAEVVRDDRQGVLPLGGAEPKARVRVQCLGCARNFAVPLGLSHKACPDCGTIHKVRSGEDGTVYERAIAVQPPDEILELMKREVSDDLAPLTDIEKRQLKNWREVNPVHLANGELVLPGDRVADPEVPGSGNPLEIQCTSYVENGCSGFTATDTPGTAVCPKCGQKFVVSLQEGVVYTRVYDAERDGPDQQAS